MKSRKSPKSTKSRKSRKSSDSPKSPKSRNSLKVDLGFLASWFLGFLWFRRLTLHSWILCFWGFSELQRPTLDSWFLGFLVFAELRRLTLDPWLSWFLGCLVFLGGLQRLTLVSWLFTPRPHYDKKPIIQGQTPRSCENPRNLENPRWASQVSPKHKVPRNRESKV